MGLWKDSWLSNRLVNASFNFISAFRQEIMIAYLSNQN